MIFLQLLAPVLSFLVLAAHFLRAGQMVLVAATLVFLVLLAVPRAWAARAAQAALALGALEWVRTIVMLIGLRVRMDLPYGRMALILGLVALLTFLSSLVFRSRRLRRYYRLDRGEG